MIILQVAAPPPWLPEWMSGGWSLFADHPFVLAALVVVLGGALAGLARYVVLFMGLKVASRTASELDEMMVRLGAFVVAVVILYVSLLTAVQTLPFGERATSILTRIVASFLVLQLMRVGLRASHLGLHILSQVRKRFAIVEERTIPLFDLAATVIVVAIAAYALLQVWNIDATAWVASAGVVGIAVGWVLHHCRRPL
jgi:small-conductance mechanosensitive channel